jgi:hypothetical protein
MKAVGKTTKATDILKAKANKIKDMPKKSNTLKQNDIINRQ